MLLDQLNEDLKTAMKARDADRLQVLRHALAQLKNARIEKGDELTDEEVVQVLRKGVKTRSDSVEMYRQGGREDLAAKESAEIEVLRTYLPLQLSGEALAARVDELIAGAGATSMKDMGKVMGAVMSALGSSVDGKEVQALVRERLTSD